MIKLLSWLTAFLALLLFSATCDNYSHNSIVNTPPANYVNLVSTNDYGGDGYDWGTSVATTSDNEYVISGSTTSNGYGENTLLCVMGDHGTTFRSEMDFARWRPYEEVIRVPWVIHWPGHVEAGRKIDWPCSQLDVTPTILSLLGFDISRAGFEGRDELVEGEADRRMYFSSWYSERPIGFVEGERKVVYWPYVDKVFEYDLGEDPGEDRPLKVEGERAERAKREIMDWQNTSQMVIDPRRQTEDFVYDHWRTLSAGSSGWAYYLKE